MSNLFSQSKNQSINQSSPYGGLITARTTNTDKQKQLQL